MWVAQASKCGLSDADEADGPRRDVEVGEWTLVVHLTSVRRLLLPYICDQAASTGHGAGRWLIPPELLCAETACADFRLLDVLYGQPHLCEAALRPIQSWSVLGLEGQGASGVQAADCHYPRGVNAAYGNNSHGVDTAYGDEPHRIGWA